MAPKKKHEPVAGQRSIATFFAAKPKAPQQDSATATASPAKLLKPTAECDVSAAKQPAAAAAATAAAAEAVVQAAPAAAPAAAQPEAQPASSNGKAAAGAPAKPAGKAFGGSKAKASKGGKGGKGSKGADSAASATIGPEAVGKAVKVFWPDDDAWYTGDIQEYSASSGKCLVLYDDGDEEWVDLRAETFLWVDRSKEQRRKAAAAGRKRKAAAVVDSDDDGAASGSEYEVSEDEGEASSDEDASLAEEEEDSEDDEELEDEEDSPPNKKGKGSKGAAARKQPAAASGKAQGKAASTPVAVPNGSVGLTPGSRGAAAGNGIGTGGSTLPASATAAGTVAKGTAMRPPRPPLPAKTPGSAATAGSLARVLDGTPMTGGGGAGGGETPGSVLRDAEAPRFAAGPNTAAFPFLHPDRIKDAAGRRPDDPDYDPRTLFVPPNWFKQAKISPGQQQWWEFKAANFDSVLLFKMGKFYELFEMDAHVAVETLGLSYMKGEKPHAGFPEAAYHIFAEKLARAGHKVVVVEQTETPEMLKERNEQRSRQGLKKDQVVRREKVAVLTQGTLTDAEMLAAQPEASYLMALAELPVPDALMAASEHSGAPPCIWIGACAVDVATGQMLVGQWLDDEMRSQLRSVLTAVQPVELVLPRGEVSKESRKVARGILRTPRFNELPLGCEDGQFWDYNTAWRQLDQGGYFPAGTPLPPALAAMREGGQEQAAAAHALGGCLSHLRDVLLDKQVLAAGRFEQLSDSFGIGAGLAAGGGAAGEAAAGAGGGSGPMYMALDGAALENLEVLENSEGGVQGTLFAALNNCVTPAGRRRLRQWLCRPLYRIPDIAARQDAVADLMGAAEEAAANARTLFKGIADLERSLARISAAGAGVGSARDAPHVVLYGDVAKKKLKAYVASLKGLQAIQDAAAAFQAVSQSMTSSLLQQLTTPGELFPDMAAALHEMWSATDWAEAERTGRVEPAPGVDAAYDAAVEGLQAAEQALKEYLMEARRAVGGGVRVDYVSVNKDSHILQVPEGTRVPASWEACTTKKGYKRYTTGQLRELVRAKEAAEDGKERAQDGILQGMMRRFAGRKCLWDAAVDCMAQLDALMSLAVAAACGSGTMCRPKLLPWSPQDGGAPVFRARGLRHPAGVSGKDGTFVPNDVLLGGPDAPPFIVLTGPNMGGKSTLMRQVCLASLMAQVGAYVPAESLEVTPADAVFVRMGARDRIMLGQSTFFVELSETSAALHRATPSSLVILDELGRGTSTGDGAAIAAAVLDHLTQSVGCRGMFATHYHHISDSHASDPRVAIKHMGCAVTPPREPGGVEEVTFLYRLTNGACPKSYGTNVARLAGLPDEVVRRAAVKASESEAARQASGGGGSDGSEDGGGDGDGIEVEGAAGAEGPLAAEAATAVQLLQRVQAACKAAAGGDEAAAAEVLRLQQEVKQLLKLE